MSRAACATSIRVVPLLYDESLCCASFDLCLEKDFPATTHDLDVDPLFDRFPGLHKHRCDSGKHRSFYDEARQTESAHLLEHLGIELLAQEGIPRSRLRGETGIHRNFEQLYSQNTQKGTLEGVDTALFRIRIYGVGSFDQASEALEQAADLLKLLVKS